MEEENAHFGEYSSTFALQDHGCFVFCFFKPGYAFQVWLRKGYDEGKKKKDSVNKVKQLKSAPGYSRFCFIKSRSEFRGNQVTFLTVTLNKYTKIGLQEHGKTVEEKVRGPSHPKSRVYCISVLITLFSLSI